MGTAGMFARAVDGVGADNCFAVRRGGGQVPPFLGPPAFGGVNGTFVGGSLLLSAYWHCKHSDSWLRKASRNFRKLRKVRKITEITSLMNILYRVGPKTRTFSV